MGIVTIHPTSYGTIKAIGQSGKVRVGKYCSLADGIKAIMVGHNVSNVSTYPFNRLPGYPSAFDSTSHPVKYGALEVGNDVWIGHSVTIMGGVRIGDGASIGACALVTKDVAPYAIVGGVPARVIGERFGQFVVEELLKIKWWDWPEEKVKENAGLLCSQDIREFIRRHKVA